MCKKVAVVAVVVLALAAYGTLAYADQAYSPAKSASSSDKPARVVKPIKERMVTLTGTIEVKTEGGAKVAYLKVSEPKTKAHASHARMAGREIKLTGEKLAQVEKLAGKTVVAHGNLMAGKEMRVLSLTESK